MIRSRRLFLLLPALLAGLVSAQTPRATNSDAALRRPYVVLVSIDGFRYDYADRHQATNILALGRDGVRAKAMLPVFPSTTFPNHYALATGMYTAHHGIVENNFWDVATKKQYSFKDANKPGNGAWWNGTPIWLLAEQQGLRAACYFWPGSDADIQNTHPSFYYPYDGNTPNETRVDQILAWLKLPERERPHLITTYFSDVDHDGHLSGPDSDENLRSIAMVDALIGKLVRGVRATGLPVNIFVVSDHGMADVRETIEFTPDEFEDALYVVAGAQARIYTKDAAQQQRLIDHITKRDARLKVLHASELPASLHHSGNARIGDLIVFAPRGVHMRIKPDKPRAPYKGMHGYNVADVPEMKAIFFAAGPQLKSGVVVDEFENIHVYPLVAHILGLTPPANIDGRLDVLRRVLR